MKLLPFKNYFVCESSTSVVPNAQEALEKIMGVCYRMSKTKGHWCSILKTHFKLFPANIPTMGVVHVKSENSSIFGNIYFGPKFVLSHTSDQLEGVLIHEMLHVLTNSHLRKDWGNLDHNVWNIATDYFINWMILSHKEAALPKNCLVPDEDGIIRSVMISDNQIYALDESLWLDIKLHDAESLYENILKWDKDILDALVEWRNKTGDIHYTGRNKGGTDGKPQPIVNKPIDQTGGVVYDKITGKYGKIIYDSLKDDVTIQLYERTVYNTSLSTLFESLYNNMREEIEPEPETEPETESEIDPSVNKDSVPDVNEKPETPQIKHKEHSNLKDRSPTITVQRKIGDFTIIEETPNCGECNQLPCICTCENCGKSKNRCECVCEICKRRIIACNCKCPTCNMKPCECPCEKCNQFPCVCPCLFCGKTPCVCPPPPPRPVDPRFKKVKRQGTYKPGDEVLDRRTHTPGVIVGVSDDSENDVQLLDIEWDSPIKEAFMSGVPSTNVIPNTDPPPRDRKKEKEKKKEGEEELPQDPDEQPIISPTEEDIRVGKAKSQQVLRDGSNVAKIEKQRSRGKGSSGEMIDTILDRLFKSTIPWQTVLREFIKVKKPIDYDWMKPANKTFSTGVYEPKEIKEEEKLVYIIAVDTSGSTMMDDSYKLFISEILGIFKKDAHAKGIVMFWHSTVDTNLIRVDRRNYLGLLSAKPTTGGTAMSCVAQYLNKFNNIANKLGGIIYFTDGATEPNVEFIHKYRGHPVKNLIVLIPGGQEQASYSEHGKVVRIGKRY